MPERKQMKDEKGGIGSSDLNVLIWLHWCWLILSLVILLPLKWTISKNGNRLEWRITDEERKGGSGSADAMVLHCLH